MEFTLLGAAVMGMGSLYLAVRWDAARANAADCARDHWDRALAGAVAGVFAGRVVAMLLDGANPVSGDILIVRAGVNTVAAALAALATVAWMGRSDIVVALDGLSGGALAGLSGWHASCLVRDSCLGTVSDLPWAIAQSSGGATRHPVEIYAALLLLIGAVGLTKARTRAKLWPFAASGLALAIAGAVRLGTEPMRLSLSGGPTGWYAAAIVVGLATVIFSRGRASRIAPMRDSS